MTNLKTLIEADMQYNSTPDLPQLRYHGDGIPVFFWDELKDMTAARLIFPRTADFNKHYEPKFFSAYTVKKYLPWYNISAKSETYSSYCLEEYEDLAFTKIPEYTISEAMQMKGKVCRVSLEYLVELDVFYETDHNFNRVWIDVYPSEYYKTPVRAFTWLNDIDQLCVFNTTTNEYELDSAFDLTPYSTTNHKEGELYEF